MKNKRILTWLVAGILSFLVAQPLSRIPILNILGKDPTVVFFSHRHPFLFATFLALSAGIFEEGVRGFLILIPSQGPSRKEGLIMGLSHGLTEAGYLVYPLLAGVIPGLLSSLALYERAIATAGHALFALWITQRKSRGHGLRGVFEAMAFHALLDMSIPLGSVMGLSPAGMEIFFTMDVLILGLLNYGYYKKYFELGGIK